MSLKFRDFLGTPILLGILFLHSGCQPNLENNESYSFLEGTTLDEIKWIHGSKNCGENTDPLIQVYKYNSSTWILRQNKCTNYEAPFMFLFAGSERALLVDTGASTSAEIFPLKQVVAELLKSWETESGIILEELIQGNRRFSEGKKEEVDYLAQVKQTVEGQYPKALGCADGRVPANTQGTPRQGPLLRVLRVGGSDRLRVG